MQWSYGNFRKDKWSIYSDVLHPHPTLNYCQLKFKITVFVNQAISQCFRIWPYTPLLSHKKNSAEKKPVQLQEPPVYSLLKFLHAIGLLITVIFLMFKIKIEKLYNMAYDKQDHLK